MDVYVVFHDGVSLPLPLRWPLWSRLERRWLVRRGALLNRANPTLACSLVSWLSRDHQERKPDLTFNLANILLTFHKVQLLLP